ncbi:hypothetical protein [Neisseria weaveri]|uniref:hypothetical protein n=1 Tax=Neisseria weaveri TaxID=28091 RepID=UPI00131AE193|nr:hypothetical protein [Neisseria weaveri]
MNGKRPSEKCFSDGLFTGMAGRDARPTVEGLLGWCETVWFEIERNIICFHEPARNPNNFEYKSRGRLKKVGRSFSDGLFTGRAGIPARHFRSFTGNSKQDIQKMKGRLNPFVIPSTAM